MNAIRNKWLAIFIHDVTKKIVVVRMPTKKAAINRVNIFGTEGYVARIKYEK